jgi:hypothetical protein
MDAERECGFLAEKSFFFWSGCLDWGIWRWILVDIGANSLR